MELVVIRHALPVTRITDDGAPADPPLSNIGHRQAHLLGRWLVHEHFDAIYSSPLLRALQTSEPLANHKDVAVEVHPGVAEFDQHSPAYVPLEELKRTDYDQWRQMMEEKRFGDGDPLEFRRVVVDAMSEIAARHRGKRVAVVCHGGVINAWASHVLGLDDVYFFDPTYTSVNRFMVASTGQKSIVTLNETAHLRNIE